VPRKLSLKVIPGVFAVCRLAPDAVIPPWAGGPGFTSVTRTGDELSVVVDQMRVPAGVQCQAGFRTLKLEGPFDFSQVGVLASVLNPLAEAGVSIFAVATYDTDYVLVKQGDLERALAVLREAGHVVGESH
jgi:hypothetical protein